MTSMASTSSLTSRMTTRWVGVFLVLVTALTFGMVWYAQDWLKLAPCELCLWERWPWRVLMVLGVLVLVVPHRLVRWVLAAAAVCLAVSIGLAVLHSGVEHGWWQSPAPECRAPVFHGGSFKEWMASMPERPNKPCDSPDYLFGLPISMTETGGVYAAFVLLVVVWGGMRKGR